MKINQKEGAGKIIYRFVTLKDFDRAENKMEIGTKFQIKKFYGKRVMTVDTITSDGFRCTDEVGDTFFFGTGAFEVYAQFGQLKIISRPKLALARKALESSHVSGVEVSLEEETEEGRYYTAVSKDNGIPHKYTVKLWEDSENTRFGKCNCLAGAKNVLCRHLIKAAELDSAKYGSEIYTPTVAEYKAHLRAA